MRRCSWCDRWFKNRQAVRAHLRHCEPYLDARAAGQVVPENRDAERAKGTYLCDVCGYSQWGDFSSCPSCHADLPKEPGAESDDRTDTGVMYQCAACSYAQLDDFSTCPRCHAELD